MSIRVQWDNEEKSLIRLTYPRSWTWDDYTSANATARVLTQAVRHRVDIILDFHECGKLPPQAMTHFGRSLREPNPSNLGYVVLVGTTGLLRVIFGVLRNLYPGAMERFHEANTLGEAYAFLSQQNQQKARTS